MRGLDKRRAKHKEKKKKKRTARTNLYIRKRVFKNLLIFSNVRGNFFFSSSKIQTFDFLPAFYTFVVVGVGGEGLFFAGYRQLDIP
jgi:hypothetical protein